MGPCPHKYDVSSILPKDPDPLRQPVQELFPVPVWEIKWNPGNGKKFLNRVAIDGGGVKGHNE